MGGFLGHPQSCLDGCVVFSRLEPPPKLWFSFWFPFETAKGPSKKDIADGLRLEELVSSLRLILGPGKMGLPMHGLYWRSR